jgi:hypothetical protein
LISVSQRLHEITFDYYYGAKEIGITGIEMYLIKKP